VASLLNLVHLPPIKVLMFGCRIVLGRKVKSPMMIRCPNCDVIGKFPDHLGSVARVLRCRRCDTRFSTDPRAAKVELAPTPPLFEASPIAQTVGSLARFSAGRWPANADDADVSSPQTVDPDDSQYELPVATDIDIEDSQVELPAFNPTPTSADDNWGTVTDDDPPNMVLSSSSPWPNRFVDSLGRYHFAVAIGFGAFSLVVLGFFLAREILGGQTIGVSVTLLIVGCVGMIAFLLLSLTVTALSLLLADLAKNVRQLRIQSEPKTRVVGD
jgi:hypothetical protein